MVPVRRGAVDPATRRHRHHPGRRGRARAQLSAARRRQGITARMCQPAFDAGSGRHARPFYYTPLRAKRS
ncbi:protein of unknown function [Burkholderia multivorans]